MTYNRDDCIENDYVNAGVVSDSLFDGCNTGISERPAASSAQWNYPPPASETVTFDHTLMRLQAMPGPRGSNNPAILGHGQLFKWSNVSNHLVVKDSVFLVEKKPEGGTSDFPPGTVASNVTVVWLGGGSFPGKIPSSGVKVTTNRSIWDAARATWLQRHGCSSFESKPVADDLADHIAEPEPIADHEPDSAAAGDADLRSGRRRDDQQEPPGEELRIGDHDVDRLEPARGLADEVHRQRHRYQDGEASSLGAVVHQRVLEWRGQAGARRQHDLERVRGDVEQRPCRG